jgi:AAA family ATP:ADP antiporter
MQSIKEKISFFQLPREDLGSILKAFFFFYFVLGSWYSIRPVRNEMAVQAGLENLPGLLSIVLLIMLIANPIYSWLVSNIDRNRVVIYTYLFFIANLLCFFLGWVTLDNEAKVFIAKAFYIWCNVFSFFVVSIFWVSMINHFTSEQGKMYFGIISAGGSLGAFSGSSIARYFSVEVCGSSSMSDWGPFSLILISIIGLTISILLSINFKARIAEEQPSSNEDASTATGASSLLIPLRGSILGNLSLYMVLWTALMTFGWMIALSIVQDWSTDPCERTGFFARIEQIVTPLTLFFQFFLTSLIFRKLGVGFILVSYGLILSLGLIFYEAYPEIMTVLLVVCVLRTFEYALCKPARETLFTYLGTHQRYKSTVFLDTFLARAGEVMGSWFAASGVVLLGLSSFAATIVALPFAALLSYTGFRAFKSSKR